MSVRSLVLGLDVSPKRLGWGLVDLVTGEPVACGMESLDLPSKGWAHQQAMFALRRVNDAAIWDSDDRRREIQAVYIEQPGLPPISGTKSAYNAGRAVQAVQGEVERRWPWTGEPQYLQPKEWRVLAGLPGNASKEDIYLRAIELGFGTEHPGDQSRVMEWSIQGGQDAADAALIAIAGQRRNQDTWDRSEAS